MMDVTTKPAESISETILAVAIAAAVAWAVSAKSSRPAGSSRRSRRHTHPTGRPRSVAHDAASHVESDWEEFDRETAELEAARRQRRASWSTAQSAFAKGV